MNEWNDYEWREKLKKLDYDCFERLCECRNNKNDIIKIASLMHCYNENKTSGECLDRTLEWIGDWDFYCKAVRPERAPLKTRSSARRARCADCRSNGPRRSPPPPYRPARHRRRWRCRGQA